MRTLGIETSSIGQNVWRAKGHALAPVIETLLDGRLGPEGHNGR
jgi:hypothetical protein